MFTTSAVRSAQPVASGDRNPAEARLGDKVKRWLRDGTRRPVLAVSDHFTPRFMRDRSVIADERTEARTPGDTSPEVLPSRPRATLLSGIAPMNSPSRPTPWPTIRRPLPRLALVPGGPACR